MKKLLLLCFLCVTQYLSAQIYLDLARDDANTFDEIVAQTESYFDTKGRGKGTGYKQFKRWEYWTKRSLNDQGKIIPAAQVYKEVKKTQRQNAGSRSSGSSTWTEMGPLSATNTSTWSSHIGRITSFGLDLTNTNHYIVGSPTGGVWKTTDNATNWTPIFDNETSIRIAALAISPTNNQHYYAGTSGLGLMRSTDGGATWNTTTGIGNNTWISRIAIDPSNSNIILASNQYGNVYRSTNAGANWTIVLTVTNDDVFDIEFKPGNSDIVYVSTDDEVYRSTNNGITYNTLTGPWNNNDAKMMAVTPDDADYLYVLEEDGGGFGALYLSTDGGNNWTTQSDDNLGNNNIMGYNKNNSGGQAPRDMDVIVSPTDKTEVHVAGVMTFRSYNSGVDWTQTTHWVISNNLPFIHADCDFMFYVGNTIYFGTDGGLFTSTDKAESVTDRTTGLGIRQFYRIGVSETEVDRVSGGSQDNGTGTVISGAWTDWVGADGMETFIAKHDEDIIYATIQFGGLYKTTNGGSSTTNSINNTPGSGDWVTPLEEDPTTNNVLYQGKAQLYKSTNGGGNWSAISNLDPTNSNDVNMVEVTIAPSNNQVIYAAYRHQVFKTSNGGTTWTDVSPSYNFSNVNYISVHPTNDQKALIVLSGVSEKVVETNNQGTTWTDITGNLPSVGAECAIYENSAVGGIYVGMNPGLYYFNNNTNTWNAYNTALPNVRVAELEIKHDFLYAGTYGRGLWKNVLAINAGCNIDFITDLGIMDCNSVAGTYSRQLEIGYSCPPTTGTLDVNGTSFPLGTSPQIVTLTNLPLNGQAVDVTVSFSASAACVNTKKNLFTNPNVCPCSIDDAGIEIVVCQDMGTAVSSDDKFAFSINPTGVELGATYSVSGDVTASGIAYGTPHIFDNNGNNFLLSNGDLTIDIVDDGNSSCDLVDQVVSAPIICAENFLCDLATTLTGPGTFTAVGPDQGGGGSNSGRNANWFEYIPSTEGLLTISSCLSSVNTRVHLHSGSCENLTLLISSDDDCTSGSGSNTLASEINAYCVNPNTTYYIEWDDLNSSDGFDFEIDLVIVNYYADTDGDGFGDINTTVEACTAPTGYVQNNTDCDDNDSANFPGNTEICDGQDNNCDGVTDEGCSGLPICDDVYLVINTISQIVYRAEINISSDAAVSGSNPILFTAGADIDLEPDFEVALGTDFQANIEPCAPGPSTGPAKAFFANNNSIEDLNSYFQLDENKGKKVRLRLITKAGEEMFSKIGNAELIEEVKQYISGNKEEKLLITLKFLEN